MSLVYNNTTIEKVTYNGGGGVNSLNWNGTKVFQEVKPYEAFLNSNATISESDFLNKVCILDTFTDGVASQFINKKVAISNSAGYSTDWEIIDYNHIDDPTGDNTTATNTFDLISEKSVQDSIKFYSTGNYNQNYEFSTVRTWIKNYANNFSSSLNNKLSTMDVVYNFNTNQPNNQAYSGATGDSNRNTSGSNKHTLSDKIKLLSCTELGYTSGIADMPYNEGTIYSNKFSSKFSTDAITSEMIRYSGSSNNAIGWWTRSRFAYSSDGYVAWHVKTEGKLDSISTNNSRSVVPVIRVSV